MISKILTNQIGTDTDASIVLTDSNDINFVFNGYNSKSRINTVNIEFLSKKCNIGDAFSITNKSHNIRLMLNPQGFANINTTGSNNNYILESSGTNTALILITAGSNTHDKNAHIIF